MCSSLLAWWHFRTENRFPPRIKSGSSPGQAFPENAPRQATIIAGGSHDRSLVALEGLLAGRDARRRARRLVRGGAAIDADPAAADPQPTEVGCRHQAARHQPAAVPDGGGPAAGPA